MKIYSKSFNRKMEKIIDKIDNAIGAVGFELEALRGIIEEFELDNIESEIDDMETCIDDLYGYKNDLIDKLESRELKEEDDEELDDEEDSDDLGDSE